MELLNSLADNFCDSSFKKVILVGKGTNKKSFFSVISPMTEKLVESLKVILSREIPFPSSLCFLHLFSANPHHKNKQFITFHLTIWNAGKGPCQGWYWG